MNSDTLSFSESILQIFKFIFFLTLSYKFDRALCPAIISKLKYWRCPFKYRYYIRVSVFDFRVLTHQFICQNYLVLVLMSMIGLKDLRLDSSYTNSERFNSVFALLIFAICILYPIFIAALYAYKIKSVIPLPDLDDSMQLEQIKNLYGTLDIKKI